MRHISVLALIFSLGFGGAEAADSGPYLYGAVGQSWASPGIDSEEADFALKLAGATNLDSSVRNTDIGYKVLLGYGFEPTSPLYVAVELGYASLGTAQYRATYTGGSKKEDAKADGLVIALLILKPFEDYLAGYVKLGAIDARVKTSTTRAGPGAVSLASTTTDTLWAFNTGLGLLLKLNTDVTLRGEIEFFASTPSSVVLASIGLMFTF